MSSNHHVDPQNLARRRHDALSKCIGDSTWRVKPSIALVGGVGPQQVDQHSTVLRFTWTRNVADLIQMSQFRRETTVHAQDAFGDESSHGKTVEDSLEVPPQTNPVGTHANFVETVDAIDGRSFVISTQQIDAVAVTELQSKEVDDGLHHLRATVNVVTQEEKALLGDTANQVKELVHVLKSELTINVKDWKPLSYTPLTISLSFT